MRKMLFQTEEEIFSKLVSSDHPFRKLNSLLNFTELALPFLECYSAVGAPGIPLEKGLKTLLVQFWEDYSDRQAEKAVQNRLLVGAGEGSELKSWDARTGEVL